MEQIEFYQKLVMEAMKIELQSSLEKSLCSAVSRLPTAEEKRILRVAENSCKLAVAITESLYPQSNEMPRHCTRNSETGEVRPQKYMAGVAPIPKDHRDDLFLIGAEVPCPEKEESK